MWICLIVKEPSADRIIPISIADYRCDKINEFRKNKLISQPGGRDITGNLQKPSVSGCRDEPGNRFEKSSKLLGFIHSLKPRLVGFVRIVNIPFRHCDRRRISGYERTESGVINQFPVGESHPIKIACLLGGSSCDNRSVVLNGRGILVSAHSVRNRHVVSHSENHGRRRGSRENGGRKLGEIHVTGISGSGVDSIREFNCKRNASRVEFIFTNANDILVS